MTQTNENLTERNRTREPAEDLDFETAQARVFEAAGLETRSWELHTGNPPVRTHVVETGAVNSTDPPLVFVHGSGTFGAMFAPLLSELDDRRLVTFDRPGYGCSDDFQYTPENIREAAVSVLRDVLDDLGIGQADVVGHGTGGFWSLVFGLSTPERVRRVVTLGGVPSLPGTHAPRSLRVSTVPVLGPLLAYLRPSGADAVVERYERLGEGDAILDHFALIDALVAHERTHRPAFTRLAERRALLELRGWRPSTRLSAYELRKLDPPALFIWGDDDPLAQPEAVREQISSMRDARLEPVAAGFLPWLGNPEFCARVFTEIRH